MTSVPPGARGTQVGTWVGRLAVLLALLLLGARPHPAAAQARARGERGDRRPPNAQRLQARLDSVVRVRLQLTEEQFVQLRGVATRLEEDRRLLRRDEMAVRVRLRRALAVAETVDQAAVAQLLDEIPRLERRKVSLLEEEQRELARFLSPSQRARYFALQEEMRRGMLELQRRRLGWDSARVRRLFATGGGGGSTPDAAQMAELADAGDSKSPALRGLWVRPPLWACRPACPPVLIAAAFRDGRYRGARTPARRQPVRLGCSSTGRALDC